LCRKAGSVSQPVSDFTMSQTDIDARHMDRCRVLAARARRKGNTPVGSLVAVGNNVVAEAEEAVPSGADPFAHAELLAVREAMIRLGRALPVAATLYTTNEPCFLCSFAIREAGIRRVVMAAPTPDIGGVTSSYPILVADDVPRWQGPPVVVWWGEGE